MVHLLKALERTIRPGDADQKAARRRRLNLKGRRAAEDRREALIWSGAAARSRLPEPAGK
jgi:hypothetical protein